MMMNGVIIHHCRATTLILWLSLVALCDPFPSSKDASGGESPGSSGDGTKTDSKTSSTNYRDILHIKRHSTTLPDSSQFPMRSHIHNNFSSSLPQLLFSTAPTSSLQNGVTNNTTLFIDLYNNSDKNDSVTVSPVNHLNSFSNKTPLAILEKGEPSSLQLSDLNPESLKKSPKLILKLDKDYSPTEIADYIFSTGDEKGFSQVVAEMVQDGEIMESKDDVILFLVTVQEERDKIRKRFHRHHYHQHQPTSSE